MTWAVERNEAAFPDLFFAAWLQEGNDSASIIMPCHESCGSDRQSFESDMQTSACIIE